MALRCPSCKSWQTEVLDSRPRRRGEIIRRRRHCNACDYKFATIEIVVDPIEEVETPREGVGPEKWTQAEIDAADASGAARAAAIKWEPTP